jgi:hypothetical protein
MLSGDLADCCNLSFLDLSDNDLISAQGVAAIAAAMSVAPRLAKVLVHGDLTSANNAIGSGGDITLESSQSSTGQRCLALFKPPHLILGSPNRALQDLSNLM